MNLGPYAINTVIAGDCLEVLKGLPDACIDTLITDPPGGISFMGKDWDSNKGGRDQWIAWLTAVLTECYRVLKPGAMALVWAIPRTSHWTGTAIENAGFEIRDQIFHLFGSGFPKSHDISKAIDRAAGAEREVIGKYMAPRQAERGTYRDEWPATVYYSEKTVPNAPSANVTITAPATDSAKTWQGYGTALKPAAEIWWLAMKPIQGTFAANALEHGVAGLNIDGCRVPVGNDEPNKRGATGPMNGDAALNCYSNGLYNHTRPATLTTGRWPSNVVHDGSPEVLAEFARYGESKSSNRPRKRQVFTSKGAKGGAFGNHNAPFHGHNGHSYGYSDTGSVARFFYCSKASKQQRNKNGVNNDHPTVKPLELMEYLCNLTRTPFGGIVLDPFAGSGTTCIAALKTGRYFLGIELNENTAQMARERIAETQIGITL